MNNNTYTNSDTNVQISYCDMPLASPIKVMSTAPMRTPVLSAMPNAPLHNASSSLPPFLQHHSRFTNIQPPHALVQPKKTVFVDSKGIVLSVASNSLRSPTLMVQHAPVRPQAPYIFNSAITGNNSNNGFLFEAQGHTHHRHQHQVQVSQGQHHQMMVARKRSRKQDLGVETGYSNAFQAANSYSTKGASNGNNVDCTSPSIHGTMESGGMVSPDQQHDDTLQHQNHHIANYSNIKMLHLAMPQKIIDSGEKAHTESANEILEAQLNLKRSSESNKAPQHRSTNSRVVDLMAECQEVLDIPKKIPRRGRPPSKSPRKERPPRGPISAVPPVGSPSSHRSSSPFKPIKGPEAKTLVLAQGSHFESNALLDAIGAVESLRVHELLEATPFPQLKEGPRQILSLVGELERMQGTMRSDLASSATRLDAILTRNHLRAKSLFEHMSRTMRTRRG